MSELTTIFGKGGTVTWNGTNYRLTALSYDDYAEFSLYLENKMTDSIERRARLHDDRWRDEQTAALNRQIVKGEFEYPSPTFLQAMFESKEGLKETLYLMLRHETPSIDRLTCHKMVEATFEGALKGLIEKVVTANTDPTTPPVTPGDLPSA